MFTTWAPAEIFTGGSNPKKAPYMEKEVGEKRSKNGPTWRKSSKKAPHIANKYIYFLGGPASTLAHRERP